MPALAPHILLRLTDEPVVAWRLGEGTLGQVLADLELLRADGAHAVVLDPFSGDPEGTRHPEAAFAMLATVRREIG